MTDRSGREVRSVDFSSDGHQALPVEVLDYRALVERVGPDYFDAAQRTSFGLVMLVRSGDGRHTVDFEDIRLVPGRLLYVRPQQVQHWHVAGDVDGGVDAAVIVARSGLCTTRGWFPGEAASCDLGEGSMATANGLIAALQREQERFVPDEISVSLMTSLFESLTGLFRRASAGRSVGVLPEPYVAFRTAVEESVGSVRSVRDLVADLGYSEKTVDRACRSVVGMSAKALLDERLVLEAKRLLAHTDEPISAVSSVLGFSEATNFNKFFALRAGERPSQFRVRLRAIGYSADDTN